MAATSYQGSEESFSASCVPVYQRKGRERGDDVPELVDKRQKSVDAKERFPEDLKGHTSGELVSVTARVQKMSVGGRASTCLEQTRARFRPDEEDWWKKYIQKEEAEQKRWETLERTGKRYVGHHPLIDYNYIETKEVSENDEESAKRVKELEKLLEKTNTFPEVSILPK